MLFGDGIPSRRARFIGYFRRSYLVSREHPYTHLYFKSTAAFTLEICRHMKTAPNTIHPCSIFRSNWEIVLLIYYTLFFAGVPFMITYNSSHINEFDEMDTSELVQSFILISLILFTFVEIILNFFTGYVSSDGLEIVLDRKRIAKRYLATFFIVDLITAIPYELAFRRTRLISSNYSIVLEYLACLKYCRAVCFMGYYNQVMKRLKIGFIVQRMVFLIVAVFLYLQFASCIILLASVYMQIGETADDIQHEKARKAIKDSTWADTIELHKMDFWDTWSNCLLKAVYLTFNLYDQYDTSQISDLIPYIILSCNSIFVLTIIAVWVVVTTRRAQAGSHLYEDLQTQLLYYLKFKKVPRVLKQRILKFFQFCFEQSYYKESTILTFISGQLRQDVLLHKSRRLLETVKLFAELPPLLAVRLASCVRDIVVLENEVLVKAGWNEDLMYYILTGTVAVYNITGEELCHLEEGDHFGEASLVLEDSTNEVSVVALETTQLWTLSRADFCYALAPDRDFLDRAKQWALRRFHSDAAGETPLHGAQLMELVKHLRETRKATAREQRRRHRPKKKDAKKNVNQQRSQSELDEQLSSPPDQRLRTTALLASSSSGRVSKP